MAEEKIIIELDIKTDKAISDTVELKQKVAAMKKELKELKEVGDENTEAYVLLNATMKATEKQLKNNEAQLAANATLQKEEIGTIQRLQASNAELRAEKQKLNLEDEQGLLRLKEINDQMDANTAQLLEYGNAEQKRVANIGKYKEDIIGAYEELSRMSKAYKENESKIKELTEAEGDHSQAIMVLKKRNEELNESAKEISETSGANIEIYEESTKKIGGFQGVLSKMPESTGGAVKGFVDMGKAAWSFVMNPIGLTIAAIVGALLLLKKSLGSTEEGQNKMNKITGMLSGAFNALLKVIKPLAMFIADYVIVYFETLGKVADKALSIVSKGLGALGFNKAAEAVDNFGASVKETMRAATELADAEAELQKVQRQSEKIQLDYQKAAEKQRQIRDDESKTMKERVAANEQLNQILQEQIKAEMSIANQALKVAELRIVAEGESTDALNQRAEALTKISDIQERITGQESEYLANVNSLRKEQQALDKEALDKKAARIEEQKKLKEEADKEEIERQKKLAEAQLKALDLELRAYEATNQSKLENDELLTQASIDEEIKRQSEIQAIQLEQLEIQKNNKLISEEEYKVAVLESDVAFAAQKTELQNQLSEQEKARKLADAKYQFELDQSILEQSLFGEFEASLRWMEADQKAEIEFANKTILNEDAKGKAILKINEKYAKAEKAIKLAKYQAEMALAGDFAKNVATIAGEQSKIGKQASAAATTISTIQGSVAAFTGMTSSIPGPVGIGLGLAAAAAALASGYANVKKILSVQSGLPGDSGGGSASGGGASTPSISVTAPVQPVSVNPSLGQGIISRQVDSNSSATMKSAFSEALKENPLQPTLVTNDVTLNQQSDSQRLKTASI